MLRPGAIGIGKRAFTRWIENDPMPLLNLLRQRKADEGAGRATISEPHERGEGFLQLHNASAGEVKPKGIGLGGGEAFEMRADFGNVGREQSEVLGNALPELLDLTGVCFELCDCERLGLVFELKLGVGARDREAQQRRDGVGEVGDAFVVQVAPRFVISGKACGFPRRRGRH